MAVTGPRQFESVVPEIDEDALVGSSIENGPTMIQFDLRKLDLQRVLKTTAALCWRKEPDAGEMQALSPFHHPITYRFMVAHGGGLIVAPMPRALTRITGDHEIGHS